MSGPNPPSLVEVESQTPKRGRRIRAAVQIGLGLFMGLAATEWVFTARADGAFPHVNLYVPDDALGARLEPNATMRFALHSNPLSVIHTNERGFRGPDWPAPAPAERPGTGDILVVGDSQVFGLGVNDDETFSAKLAQSTGRTVINGGVPTYGPLEYLATTRELLEERRPGTVVYVLNFVNDPFELARPNAERHAIWDGWAVRIETAPVQVSQFPGRKWLFQKSHAFYAVRRFWHDRTAHEDTSASHSFPSEGVWTDLLALTEQSQDATRAEEATRDRIRTQRLAAVREAIRDVRDNEERIDRLVTEDRQAVYMLSRKAEYYGKSPGDIVRDRYSESGRPIKLTAEHIRAATRARRELEERLAKRKRARDQELARALANRTPLVETAHRAQARASEPVESTRFRSVFAEHLREVADACAAHGAELVVVALPIDIQVSAQEWTKYGEEPVDMSESLVLLADLVHDARALGARTLDATLPLRDAEPGAFLDGDIHMTPKGHAALAHALVDVLAEPAPGPPPGPLPSPPTCAEGEVLMAAAGRCARSCDVTRPCSGGTCVPYGDGSVCVGGPA